MDTEELIARAEIVNVLVRYAHAVDRQDFELVRTCYHPDAHDDHGPYKGGVDGLIAHFEELGPKLELTSHQFGNHLIVLEGDTAYCESYCLYWRKLRGQDPASAMLQGLRYLDRFERRDGRWAIADRTVVVDWLQASPPPQRLISDAWVRGAQRADDPAESFFAGRLKSF